MSNQVSLTDTHAHLDLYNASEVSQVLERARVAGVNRVISVGDRLRSSKSATAIAKQFAEVWAAVGVHPHDASSLDDKVLASLEALAADGKVVAIGETGLDFFRLKSPKKAQQEALAKQFDLANKAKLPVIVHCRQAYDELIAFLKKLSRRPQVLVHCFSGEPAHARELMALGCFISFSGTLTFKNAESTRQTLKAVPLDRLVLETDSPYLSPEPFRGQPNQPAHLRATAETAARLLGISLPHLAEITSRNADLLFKLAG